MAKLRNQAAKKSWQDLPPHDQFSAFCQGDVFAKDPWATHFAMRTNSLLEWLKKKNGPVAVFRKARPDSIEGDSQQVMNEAMALLFNCWEKPNGTNSLRNLADAIDSLKKPLLPAVDRHRAWLWCQFHPYDFPGKRPLKVSVKFSELREAFDKEFPDGELEDSPLRAIVRGMGIILAPDPKGPKGPRIIREN